VAPDRDSQAVHFVEPTVLHGPGQSIGQDNGLTDKLGLRFSEGAEDCCGEDCCGAGLHTEHESLRKREDIFASKGAQVVTDLWQSEPQSLDDGDATAMKVSAASPRISMPAAPRIARQGVASQAPQRIASHSKNPRLETEGFF